MASTQNKPTTDTTVAQMLRDAADWLDTHPEVHADSASIAIHATRRTDLESLAAALGGRATERVQYGDVLIEGFHGQRFRPPYVRVYGAVKLTDLAPEPPEPRYPPILAGREDMAA